DWVGMLLGILIAVGAKDAQRFCVPELYAAAIRPLTEAEQLHTARIRVAEQLLAQERFGIPLDDHESEFCVFALNDADRLNEIPHALLQRVLRGLVAFGGSQEARDLILRSGDFAAQIDPLLRARLAAALRDPLAGLDALAPALRFGQDQAPSAAELALHSQLVAESGLDTDATPHSELADGPVRDAKFVFDRRNSELPLGADFEELVRIAQSHPTVEVALSAELLVRFECARQGVRCLDFAQNNVGERLGQAMMLTSDETGDLLGMLVLTYCTIRALSGHYQAPLFAPALLARLPGAHRHLMWMTHLSSAMGAMSCGDPVRAGIEWELFMARIPGVAPIRLRRAFAGLNEVLRDPDGQSTSTDQYARQVRAYLQRDFS
ncbi:MAG: hypothetical protein J0H64_02350, partial [Actinobacteria bacterium]|nr:hypothetical protein [Actinomycetota bacterium]